MLVDSFVFRLKSDLELKQKGSIFIFPKGTNIAIVLFGKKYMARNDYTKTTVDALTGTISPSIFKKVKNSSIFLGNIPSNKDIVRRMPMLHNIMLDLRKKGKRCFQENQGLYYRIFVEKKNG